MIYHTEIVPVKHPKALNSAAAFLREGDLIAFPTDTVYGLGALAFNYQAVEKLYQVKKREITKAIAVLVGNISVLSQVSIDFGYMAEKLARRFWPGPLTIVVQRNLTLPENLSSTGAIGIRMPDHAAALDLLESVGPLAVTSANLSGKSSTLTASEVFAQLKGRIPMILDGGRTPGGIPSTVVDCTGAEPVELRKGPITFDQILNAVK